MTTLTLRSTPFGTGTFDAIVLCALDDLAPNASGS
jgi:hypothetical protein